MNNKIPEIEFIAPNFTKVVLSHITLWYSYTTVIGFYVYGSGGKRVVSENCWSTTTGKHLNQLGDKTDCLPRKEFETLLEMTLQKLFIQDVNSIIEQTKISEEIVKEIVTEETEKI